MPVTARATRRSRRWWSTTATRCRWRRNRPRWPKASRVKTCSPWYWSSSVPIRPTMPTSCCRPPPSSSTWMCTRPTAIHTSWPTTRLSRRWARPCQTPRSSAAWPSAWALSSRALPIATRTSLPKPSWPRTRARQASAGTPSRRRGGKNSTCRRRRLPRAALPRRPASASSTRRSCAATASIPCPTTCPRTRHPRPRRNWQRAIRWR